MEDIFVTNPQKAFKYAKMKLERMDMIKQEMIELLPQTYLDCYELCLALGCVNTYTKFTSFLYFSGEKEIAEIFAVKGKQMAKVIRGQNSLWFKLGKD